MKTITEKIIEIDKATTACPTKEGWNYHPKVFLNLEFGKTVQCPYCGTKFTRRTKN